MSRSLKQVASLRNNLPNQNKTLLQKKEWFFRLQAYVRVKIRNDL